jgi:hypothetical protein
MRYTRLGLGAAVVASLLPLVLGGWMLLPRSDLPSAALREPPISSVDSAVEHTVDSLAGRARRAAPFRADGRPSRVAYDPARSEAPSGEYQPPKPVLVVTGLLGGDRPLVVVQGVPGRDAPALLGVGDTIAGLKVQRIKEGRVTITGMDTTWVLAVRGAQ